jgi:hypothetical protein
MEAVKILTEYCENSGGGLIVDGPIVALKPK